MMINLGPLTIYSQGLALGVAVVVSSYVFWREGVKKKFEEEALLDFVLVTLVGGIIGGRLLFFLLEQNLTWSNFFQLFKIWQGGGTLWYGALVGGFLAGSVFAQRNFWDLKKIWDTAVPALLLGQAIGSLPTYPLESLFFFILFVTFFSTCQVELAAGLRAIGYLILTSLLRFLFEFFRIEKTFFLGVNLNQIFSLVFLILGVVGLREVYQDSKRDLKEDLMAFKVKLKVPKLPRIPLAKFKKQLSSEEEKLEEQQQKLAEENPLLEPERTHSNPEMVAEAEEEISHHRFAAVREAVVGRAAQVKQALSRMKKGKYGVCAECSQPIDPARLKADPSVTLCLDCQEKKELSAPSA